ncbi:hypothetical protein TKWG_03745 [Advenella kashmirensis WT001]|uniref:Uncharacterized protein n=1 Tax=Advenella kashmirensis (strain DSM 17095 / LMG 22695 / WT001) TaxID=1036672 RepID=I3U8I4_ADVKW|nr:hypothetical protein TKWG_03745 [Advenella kashmirensis WT001]
MRRANKGLHWRFTFIARICDESCGALRVKALAACTKAVAATALVSLRQRPFLLNPDRHGPMRVQVNQNLK